jgi:hypothetical protein
MGQKNCLKKKWGKRLLLIPYPKHPETSSPFFSVAVTTRAGGTACGARGHCRLAAQGPGRPAQAEQRVRQAGSTASGRLKRSSGHGRPAARWAAGAAEQRRAAHRAARHHGGQPAQQTSGVGAWGCCRSSRIAQGLSHRWYAIIRYETVCWKYRSIDSVGFESYIYARAIDILRYVAYPSC